MEVVMGRFAVVSLFALLSAAPAWTGEPGASEGGLTLALEVQAPPAGTAEVPTKLKVRFGNAGTRALTFFIPEHFSAGTFPAIRFVRGDGVAFVPYDSPFQSEWTTGVQGALPELAPGKSWETEYQVDLVVRHGAKDAELTPLPLEPGRYRVEAAHEQKDTSVPMGGAGFSVSQKAIPGLWTGRVAAKPVDVEIPRPKILSLRIDAPRTAMPGVSYPLTVVLRNDTDRPATLSGGLRVSASTKPGGTASARVRLAASASALKAGEKQDLTLAPGTEQRFVVELMDLPLAGGRKDGSPQPLTKWVEQGLYALDAVFESATGTPNVSSNLLWRYVNPARVR
jgi:hypothetical protein